MKKIFNFLHEGSQAEVDFQKIKRHTFLNTCIKSLEIKDKVQGLFEKYNDSELGFEHSEGFFLRTPFIFYGEFFIDVYVNNSKTFLNRNILEGYIYKEIDKWTNGLRSYDAINIYATLDFLNLTKEMVLDNSFLEEYIWISDDILYGKYNGIDCYYHTNHMFFKDENYDPRKKDFLKITRKDNGEIVTWLEISEGENIINDEGLNCSFTKKNYKRELIHSLDRSILFCEIAKNLNLKVSKSYE